MLTVIEDAGLRLPEVAAFLAAAAVLTLAMKDFLMKVRNGHGSGRIDPPAARSSRVPPR
jgi:hypothetical protein